MFSSNIQRVNPQEQKYVVDEEMMKDIDYPAEYAPKIIP
jgi:hypothetical protein